MKRLAIALLSLLRRTFVYLEKKEVLQQPFVGAFEKERSHVCTLQDYLDASFAAGLQLQRLVDVPTPEGSFTRREDTLIPEGYHFPFFTILSFLKA